MAHDFKTLKVSAALRRGLFATVCLFLVASCTPRMHNPGKPLADGDQFKAGAYRFSFWAEQDHAPALQPNIIIVTLSGGGTRAAAMGAATLNYLHQFTINSRPLTDNVIFISATSGGSIAAGYIAAHGFDHYDEFRKNFLLGSNTSDLIETSIGPRLFYDRSFLLQNFLEKRLDLKGITFGELANRQNRPFVVFNATDISAGHPFRFTQKYFDLICSNLRDVPISSGIVASAAFPFLITDVELRNKWDKCQNRPYSLSGHYSTAADAVEDHYRYDLSHAYDMVADPKPSRRQKFIHLADGGLVDNVGVRSIDEEIYLDELDSISGQIGPRESHFPNIRQILFLQVNARSDTPNSKLDSNAGSPSFFSLVNIVTGIPIDQTTSLSTDYARTQWERLATLGGAYTTGGIMHVEVDYDLIPDSESALRQKVKSIGSFFDITKDELEAIERSSVVLLDNNPCFQRFLGESGATSPNRTITKNPVAQNGWPYGCQALNDPPHY